MALKVHRVVVVGCPRCVLTAGDESQGVGKSCLCNRFVRPDSFTTEHSSRLSPEEWRDDPVYNRDHFLYWGAATKRLPDGTRARFQVVEQTEFSNIMDPMSQFPADFSYSKRATATLLTSSGKIAYRLHSEQEYAIPTSLKKNAVPARATQLFPNYEFGEGKGVTAFLCVFDPTLKGEDISRQVDFLTRFLKELVKTKRKVVVVCTKCDQVDAGKIQLGANLAATVCKKPIPFIQTSAVENVNVLEAFHFIVGANKVKRTSFYSKNGKKLPGIISTYHDAIQLRGKDGQFAVAEFTKAINDKVNSFDFEWSAYLPMLSSDPIVQNFLQVIGEEEAKKIYCQRIMQLKVDELRKVYGRRHRMNQEQSRNFQSELLEAFTNHPDLGNDAFYQCLYAPSIHSDMSTIHSPSSDEADITSPLSYSSHSNYAPNRFLMPETVQLELSSSLGSPVPDINIPPLNDKKASSISPHGLTPVRQYPLESLGIMNKLNRSTEVLATFPRVTAGVHRHHSLRFQHRTLPPLPTFHLTSSTENFAKSEPHLDETDSAGNNSSLERQQKRVRRLSSSLTCLSGSDTFSPPMGEPGPLHQLGSPPLSVLDVEPYLHPVEIKQIMDSPVRVSLPSAGSASMRVGKPKNRPSLPVDMAGLSSSSQSINRPKLLKDKDGGRLVLREQLSHPGSLLNANKSRSTSSPPPALPSSATHHTPNVLSPQGESSLDFPNSIARILGYHEKSPLTILGSDDSDGQSVKSGPFATINEEKIPTLASDEEDCPDALSVMPEVTPKHILSGRNGQLHESIDSTASGGVFQEDFGYSNDPSALNLYASIPENENDEYLMMSAAPASIGSHVQGVIKKLQHITHESTRHQGSAKHRHVSADDVHVVSPSAHIMKRTSTMSMARPLPPSPTKARRNIAQTRIPIRRKSSKGHAGKAGGDSNIYESIDEEWIDKIRREVAMVNELTSGQDLNPVMEMFWSLPDVREHWLRCIRTIFPGFQPPSDDSTLSPFSINPLYLASSTLTRSSTKRDAVTEPINEERGSKESSPLAVSPPLLSDPPPPLLSDPSPPLLSDRPVEEKTQKALRVTDSFLERINRQLHRGEESSSSDDDDDESDMESCSETTVEDSTMGDTLDRTTGSNLSIIREQFGTPFNQRNGPRVIDLCSEEGDSELEEENCLINDGSDLGLLGNIPASLEAFLANGSFSEDEPKRGPISLPVEEKAGTSSLEVLASQHLSTKNGHLSVRTLSSRDSGISANDHNGIDDS